MERDLDFVERPAQDFFCSVSLELLANAWPRGLSAYVYSETAASFIAETLHKEIVVSCTPQAFPKGSMLVFLSCYRDFINNMLCDEHEGTA